MLDLMADEPSMVGFIGHLPLGSEDFARNLARFAANPRFVGVRRFILKEAALESEPVMTSLRDLQSRNLTLELVVIDRMRLGDAGAVAAALPNLRIVVDHVGGMPIQGTVPDSAWARDIRILGRHANVYLKISGLYQNTKRKPAPTDASYYAPTLDAVWEAFGEDRLLYGSNWPVTTLYGEYGPNVDIARSYFATRGPVVLEKVMWHNAVNAYNLALEN